ncbi:hypothetical protein MBLNU457_7596t2 [Dothideomycetes sp. NU457]
MDFSRGYVIYRDTAVGEPFDPSSPLQFFPAKDSDELFFALKAAYPSVSTHSERMRNAVIEFLLAEGNSQQVIPESPLFMSGPNSTFDSNNNSPQSLWQDSSSASSTYSPQLSDNDSPSISGPSPSSAQQSSQVPSMTTPPAIDQMTSVFSLSTHVQPKSRTKRKMTEDEKVTYRRRRQTGACAKCKLQKRKCVHTRSDAKPTSVSAASAPQISDKAAGKRPARPTPPPIDPTEPLFTPQAGFDLFDLTGGDSLFDGMDDLMNFDDLIDLQPSTLLNNELLNRGDHVGLYYPHPSDKSGNDMAHPPYNSADDMIVQPLQPMHTLHTHSQQGPSSSPCGQASSHYANVHAGLHPLPLPEPLLPSEQSEHAELLFDSTHNSAILTKRKPTPKRRLPNTLHSDVSGSQPTHAELIDRPALLSHTGHLPTLDAALSPAGLSPLGEASTESGEYARSDCGLARVSQCSPAKLKKASLRESTTQTREKLNSLALRKELLPSRTGEVLPVPTELQVLSSPALTDSRANSQASRTSASGGLRSPSSLGLSEHFLGEMHSAVPVPRKSEVSRGQNARKTLTAARLRTSIASGGLHSEPSLEGGSSLDRLSELSTLHAVSADLDSRTAADLPLSAAMLLHLLLKTVQEVQSAFIVAAAQLADNSGIAGSCAMENTMCAGLNALTLVEA